MQPIYECRDLERVAALIVFPLLIPIRLQAQIPDEFVNLKVLQKDISKKDLVEAMKSFTRGLGVRCEYCHVGEANASLETFDFAADKKETKKKARIMIQMTRDINTTYLSKLETKPEELLVVRCATCHHGQTKPQSLEDVLLKEVSLKGVEAAVTKYQDLRENFYGTDSFDFSESPLNRVALSLLSEGNVPEAIRFLKLNLDKNPDSREARFYLAEAYFKAGDKKKARELQKGSGIRPPE